MERRAQIKDDNKYYQSEIIRLRFAVSAGEVAQSNAERMFRKGLKGYFPSQCPSIGGIFFQVIHACQSRTDKCNHSKNRQVTDNGARVIRLIRAIRVPFIL
jgi:hypothetical protein